MAGNERTTVQSDKNYDDDDDETSTTSSTTTTTRTETATTTLTSRTASSGAVYHTTEMASDGAVSPRIDDQDRKVRRKQGVQKLGYIEMRNIINGTCRVEEPRSSSLVGQPKLQSIKSSRSLESVLSTLNCNNQLSSSYDSRQRRISENLDGKRHEENANIFRWSSDSSHSSIHVQLDHCSSDNKKKLQEPELEARSGQSAPNVQQNNDSGDHVRPNGQTGVVCATFPVPDTNDNHKKCTVESAFQVDVRNHDVGRPSGTNKIDAPIFKSVTNSASNALRISPLQRSPLRPTATPPIPNRSANKPDRSNFNEMLFDYLLYLIDARWNELGDDFRRLVQEKCGSGHGGSSDRAKSSGRLTENELKMCKNYLHEFNNEDVKKKFSSMIDDFAYQFGNDQIQGVKETLPSKRLSLGNLVPQSTSPVSTPSRRLDGPVLTPKIDTSACKIESTSAWTERTSDLSLQGTVSADSSCLSSGEKRRQKAPKVLELVAMLESKNQQQLTGGVWKSNPVLKSNRFSTLTEQQSTSATGTREPSGGNSRYSLSIKDRMNDFLAESLKLQNLEENNADQSGEKKDQFSTPESLETKEVEKCRARSSEKSPQDQTEKNKNADLFILASFPEMVNVNNQSPSIGRSSCIEMDKKRTDTFTCLEADIDENIDKDLIENVAKRDSDEPNVAQYQNELTLNECLERNVNLAKDEPSSPEPQIFSTGRAEGDQNNVYGLANTRNFQESEISGTGDAKNKKFAAKLAYTSHASHTRPFNHSTNLNNVRSTVNRSTSSARNVAVERQRRSVVESSSNDKRRHPTKIKNRTPVSTMTVADFARSSPPTRRTTSNVQSGRLSRHRSVEFNHITISPLKSSSISKKVAPGRPNIRMTKAAILRSKAIRQNYSLQNSPLRNASFIK